MAKASPSPKADKPTEKKHPANWPVINLRPELHPESEFKKIKHAEITLLKFGLEGAPPFNCEHAMEMLKCNLHNRPRKTAQIAKYANDIIRKKWFAGEPILVSKKNVMLDGQNRCLALLTAEKMRQRDPEYYKAEYGWTGPVTMPMLIIAGIDDKQIDSINTGMNRSAPDVMFRKELFDDYKLADRKTPEFKDADKKRLATILGGAIRVVWLRVGGKDVASAPKFPHSEMVEFLAKHPRIKDAVVEVYRSEDGPERHVSSLCSPAYLAGVMYLGAAQETDRSKYDATGDVRITDKSWKSAVDFVETFASGVGLEKGDPLLVCRDLFHKQLAEGGSRNRDTLLNTLVKTWNAYSDGAKGLTSKVIIPGQDEICRIGGLDTEPVDEDEDDTEPTAPEDETEAAE